MFEPLPSGLEEFGVRSRVGVRDGGTDENADDVQQEVIQLY
jgi:hypothetical protein